MPLVVLWLLCLAAMGCAPRKPPQNLQALPHADGKIRLTWLSVDDMPGTRDRPPVEGLVVQRRGGDGAWQVIAERAAPHSSQFVDDVGPARQPFTYRIATVRADRQSRWSNKATSLPTFVGFPLAGWLNVADYDTCTIPGVSTPHPIQCAIHDLGGRTDDFSSAVGPHVVYLPSGTYDVPSTLFVEGRAGIQLIGERPGDVVLRWTGRQGATPDDAAVMFHAEGNRDATFRNLIWDGNCQDPDTCFVVAFDQSFCGRPNGKILRANDCGTGGLDWPENPNVGVTDNGSAHIDSVFRNAFVGLRLGHHGVADSETTFRRCRFENNFAGASLEDFNALRHWFWDPTFTGNYVAITNDIADVRKTFDRSYAPGVCAGQDGEPACFYSQDCDGVRCQRPSRWGGDFAVHRGRFIDNRHTDVWAQPTGEFILRDSWSVGARRFFYGAGPNASRGSFSLIGNAVHSTGSPVVTRSPGTFLLLDNRLTTQGDGPAVVADALVGVDPNRPDSGAVDLVSVGNSFNTEEPYEFRTQHRLRELERATLQSPAPIDVPGPANSGNVLAERPVYTVTEARSEDGVANAARIQSILDAALADPRPAVVHFPGGGGRYPIAETLTIPPGADLTLLGDGAFTTIWWVGPPGQPALRINATDARGLTIRDLNFLVGGIAVTDLEAQDGPVLLNQLRLDESSVAGLVLQELDNVRVDITDLKSSFGLLGGDNVFGVVVDVGKTSDARGEAGVTVWSGDTGRNQTDYLVLNDDAGARLLVQGNYMEKSRQHLRVDGRGASGEITFLGSKLAPTVPLVDPDDPAEVAAKTATVAVDDFAGRLNLLQSQMFIVDPNQSGDSDPAAVDHGARIRVTGDSPLELELNTVGLALRGALPSKADSESTLDNHEVDFSSAGLNRVSRLRLAGKRTVRDALPVPDLVSTTTDGRESTQRVGTDLTPAQEQRLLKSLEHVRAIRPPVFYDQADAIGAAAVRLDKVFVFKAPVALTLSAGTPCFTALDCEPAGTPAAVDEPQVCDREGLPDRLPGRCRASASPSASR